MAEIESREVMNECIDTIRRGEGRAKLQSTESHDPTHNLETTSNKPPELEYIMDLLQYKEDRVAHDHKKFFLFREGTTSYVYLASVKVIWLPRSFRSV